MPIRSAFFESTGGDRRYTADRWAQIFAAIVTQGYIPGFGNGLAVVESIPAAMSVMISTGAGLIQGRYVEVYTTPVSLAVGAANATQYRRDLVILRLDLSAGVRDVVATVKAGALAATAGAAVYPTLQRDATIYEVALAGILVAPSDTAIQNSEITDLREVGTNFGRSGFPDLFVHKTAAVLDHPDASVTDVKLGSRTAVSTYPTAQTNGPFTLTAWLGYFINMLLQIVGGTSWWSVPPSTMVQLDDRTSTLEGQLGDKIANDAAGEIALYNADRRVYDSMAVRGIYGADAPGYLAVLDTNRRVFDSNALGGQAPSFYASAFGLSTANAAIAAINSVQPYSIMAFPTAAYIPASGYTRLSAADGRVLMGGGTTFGVAFTEGTLVGSSWSHAHSAAGLTATASATTTGSESAVAFLAAPGGGAGSTNVCPTGHTHPMPAETITLAGTLAAGQVISPALVVAYAQKS